MPDKTFELVLGGKTYTTLKVTPMLRGKLLQILAYTQKETEGYTQDEIQTLQWLQVAIAGALYEHAPPVMWDFLKPEDKVSIGTKENFLNQLDAPVISAFFTWAVGVINEANDFLEPSQAVATAPPSPSEPSTPSLPEDTAGAETPANP